MTKAQIGVIAELMANDKMYFMGTYNTNPDYENFLEETFGENWLDLHLDIWERCYEYEFHYDWYVYQVTGIMSEEMKEWIKEGLESLEEYESEVEIDNN